MNPCELPPCPPCPPPPYPPCPQICPPAPPPPQPPCRNKPIMRGLHWSQTKRKLAQAIFLSVMAGASVYFFVGQKRRQMYRDYYAKAEFEDEADEMAKKGLFQAVPREEEDEKT